MIVGSGNFGIKNKKCLIVGNPALKSISGEFDNDNLEVICTGYIAFSQLIEIINRPTISYFFHYICTFCKMD